MYRIIPIRLKLLAFGWLVLAVLAASNLSEELLSVGLRWTVIPTVTWLCLGVLVWNPVWRFVWRRFPRLNSWFPDLNGTWDVELCSNWPRQVQLLEAAQALIQPLDMSKCEENRLALLKPLKLKAEIYQSWWKIEMRMTNPSRNTPIKHSEADSVDPIPGEGMRPPAICYFFKQENDTGNVSDDSEFYGAARLSYDPATDSLHGLVWTARMWRRAMNTAGSIVFTRA